MRKIGEIFEYQGMQNKINIGNDIISYEEFGSGKEVIILLPSLWVTSRSYRTLGKELSIKYRVLIPNLYKGESSFSKNARSVDDYTRALDFFTEKLKIDCFYLLSISFGGFISVRYQQLYARKARKVFLSSTLIAPIKFENRILVLFWGSLKLLFYNSFSVSGIKTNLLWIVDGLVYFIRHPKQFLLEGLIATKEYDYEISEMFVPTKLLFALKDEFINVAYLENMKSIGNLEIETINARHAWFFSKEKILRDKVFDFFNT